jgi:hypothetical protein
MARDYTYDKAYLKRPEQRKANAARKRARRLMIKKHGESALKGKDIDHKNGNPNDNRTSNLTIMSKSKNRSKK